MPGTLRNFFRLEARRESSDEWWRMIHPAEAAGHTNYRALAERLGEDVLKQRIIKQAKLWTRETHQGTGFLRIEGVVPVNRLVTVFLTLTGTTKWGLRNYLDVRVVENPVPIRNLPAAFEGFRLLQLADLHCDLCPPLIDKVVGLLDGLDYDAVVLTGDYHDRVATEHELSLELMGKLVKHLKTPRYGVLGNHDFIEKVAYLEDIGLPLLMNECAAIERGGERLWICGVDDPHFFGTHDLAKARAEVPASEPAILLSHSPEPYKEAEALGYQFMLSGHTHGGQFCLPGGIPILRNADVPRSMLAGMWRHGDLLGYTSRGTGGCGVAARFFCPPEMTVHILRRA